MAGRLLVASRLSWEHKLARLATSSRCSRNWAQSSVVQLVIWVQALGGKDVRLDFTLRSIIKLGVGYRKRTLKQHGGPLKTSRTTRILDAVEAYKAEYGVLANNWKSTVQDTHICPKCTSEWKRVYQKHLYRLIIGT